MTDLFASGAGLAISNQLTAAWGQMLQVWVDGSYTILLFGINFSVANFALMIALIIIGIIVAFGRKKLFWNSRWASVVR